MPVTNYNWGPSGAYAVLCVVTNTANCTAQSNPDTIFLYTSSPVTVTATSNPSNAAVCAGSQLTLTGGGATTYTWSNGVTNNAAFTPSMSGTYTVNGTDANCCKGKATKTITVNQLPMITASSSTVSLCMGGTATLTAGGADTYTWSTGATTVNVAVSPTITATYTLVGTDVNGCENMTTLTQTVSNCNTTGIEQTLSNTNQILVYPNPSNGNFVVTTPDNATTISVTDVLGNELLSVKPNGTTTNVNLSAQPNGMYFIKVSINGVQTIKRIIINN